MQLINIIGVLCVFVLLLLAGFLLSVKTQNKIGNRLLAVFLMLTALNISGWFVWILLPGTNERELFRITFSFLEMPVFYLYVLAICYQNFKLKLTYLSHTIPFVFVNLLSMLDLTNRDLISAAINIQWLSYILLVGFTLRKFRRIYLQNYTETSNQSYQWLKQLTLVFFIVGSIATVKEIVAFTSYDQVFNWLQIVVGFSALSVTTGFILKVLFFPELFRGVSSELQLVETLLHQGQVNTDSVKDQDVDLGTNLEIMRIKEYMYKEMPYLDPSLTLQKLATQMKIPSKNLSILINHKMGQHFFDFINRYRIEAAAKLLENHVKHKLTVLEILYQVGFNSKSSFNTAFKIHIGLTPTQYRKRQLGKVN